MNLRCFIAGLALLTSVAWMEAAAQTAVASPAPLKVGISIEAERAPIQDILPRVRKTVADDYSARNVQPVILLEPEKSLMAAARNAGCDYVVRVKILELAKGAIDLTHPGASTEPGTLGGVPGARPFVPGEIRIEYKVAPVKPEKLKIQDSYSIPPQQYPLGPDYAALQSVAAREARAAAATALARLKKYKGL